MPCQMVVDKLRAGYNTPRGKLSLQSEVDYLNFNESMARYPIQYEKECPRQLVEYFNNFIPLLVDGFHTKSNKIRYPRNVVLGYKWATTFLENIFRANTALINL